MTFELTEELTRSIISAMENQDADFLVDAKNAVLVESSVQADEEYFYGLPEWTAADGFSLREDFVAKLHAPLAKEELQQVLHSGRGVFRNFRDVLKRYPEVDKRWHIFKHNVMSARINEWYNALCEIWGLEKLDQFSESDESLVHDDFSFKDYDSSGDKETVLFNILAFIKDDETLPLEMRNVKYDLWSSRFTSADFVGQNGFVCNSLLDEFAGCITSSSVLRNQEKVDFITCFFVPEKYRGFGIAAELLAMLIDKSKQNEKNGL